LKGSAAVPACRRAGFCYGNAVIHPCKNTAMPYMLAMHTIIETAAYLVAAADAGMAEGERNSVVDVLAANPMAGDVMPGCGGARKLRVARRGKGKSGGYRVITYFGGDDVPVFLLTVFGKNERANLTQAERNGLAALTKRLKDSF
jgi:hypothetical protein